VTRLLLARHGQSTWNADGRWQGQADPPLSELGERQAADAAIVLQRPSNQLAVDRVWASTLQRARRTAVIIASGLALEVEVDPRLQEVDAGEWSGLTRAEIDADWPGYLAEHRRPPGFETQAHLAARALDALDAITATAVAGSTVLVVTHGGVIGAVERHLGADWERTPNLGGREVLADGGRIELGERFLLLDPDDVEVTTPRQI
jgi:probable phosphoglycerate mutase